MKPFAMFLLLLLAQPLRAQQSESPDPSLHRYSPRQHGPARLEYSGSLAVLRVAGTPEQMGEQLGVLLKPELTVLRDQAQEMIEKANLKTPWNFAKNLSTVLARKFPEAYRQEMLSLSKASDFPIELLYTAHMAGDLLSISGCSDVVVEKRRSDTGQVLFGRNMDFNPAGFQKYGLVVVYLPSETTRHAFAHVSYPGLLGVSTGMNDAGLCIGHNSIYAAADGASPFSATGASSLLMTRRMLEECSTAEEAVALAKKTNWAGRCALMLADTNKSIVIEITTKNVVARDASDGLLLLTNHLRCSSLAPKSGPESCARYQSMARKLQGLASIAEKDVLSSLALSNQGGWTIQSVLFRPGSLQALIALGDGQQSATARPYSSIDLKPMLKR